MRKLLSGCALAYLGFLAPLHPASQNKFIAKKFRWQVARTEHFDLYYYPGSERLLPRASEALERAYRRVTPALGISIPGRSSFFLYLNHNEFEQNNIVDVGEGTGGVTEAFKSRFLVFNDGTQTWLDHVIAHEFVHVAQFQVLYAGFWRSIRLLKSVFYPLWFMEGMAEFYSAHRDEAQEEMVLRDAVTSGTYLPLPLLHGFNHVKPHQVTLAYKTGDAALKYIAQEYGEDKIGLILKDLAEKFDVANSLQEILGVSLRDLDRKLLESLQEKYQEEIRAEGLKEPEAFGRPLTRPDGVYPVFDSHPAFFPDGRSFAYLSDKDGFTELFRYDPESGRSASYRLQERFPGKLENIHPSGSALAISPDGRTLLFAGESKQKDFLYLYDSRRDRLDRLRFPLDNVSSPQFSPDGKRIVFVGMKGGVTDLYEVRRNGKGLKILTDTIEDENDPRFFPDGETLLFTRESPLPNDPEVFEKDLWTLSLKTGKAERLTDLAGNEMQPAISTSGREIVFVNDAGARYDLYRMNLDDQKAEKITRVVGGNFYPVFVPGARRILFVSHRKGEQHIYEWKGELPGAPSAPRAPAASLRPGPPPDVEASTGVLRSLGRPYGFRASTDFFFPIFYYSSTDGLFLSAYWQASEMLGNHQVQAAVTYASAFNFLNYQILYSYLRFRPQVQVGFLGDTQENVFVTARENRREDAQFVGVLYPLNRFDSVQARWLTTQRRIEFTDDQFVTLRTSGRENTAQLSFFRDVARGRYLEATRGYRLSASYEESNRGFGSTLDYRNLFATWNQFVPLFTEGSLAFRLYGGAGFGAERQFFRTGGSDLLRGYGRFDPNAAASRFLITNAEFRFPLLLNINAHVWFFFPDFLFKNIYGSAFMDTGILWNDRDELLGQSFQDFKHSLGLGLRFQAFVLQTFPISIRADWARRTLDGDQSFYLSLGPSF